MGEVESGGPAAKPVAAHTPQAGDSGARREVPSKERAHGMEKVSEAVE